MNATKTLDELREGGRLFLTAKEAAPWFATDPRTLTGALARGEIPGAFRLGQQWRIPVAAILRLAEGGPRD